jgi:PKD repeat protein
MLSCAFEQGAVVLAMRSTSSFSRRCALVLVIISPVLSGYFKCVAVSNPSVPTASIDELEPNAPRVGEIVNASGSGNGTPPLQFAWDFGDGTLAGGMRAAHAYIAPGRYTVVLTVRDALGNTARDTSQVAVSPLIQPAVTSMEALSSAIAGQPVMFMATALDADAGPLTYVWTFSDGQFATGPQTVAIFPMAGTYLASVSATNAAGVSNFREIAFEVVDAKP